MPTHIVNSGECLATIADQNGLGDYKPIWDDPKNKHLRDTFREPNMLVPGDKVELPERREREESRSVDSGHKFKRKRVRVYLRLRLVYEDGLPLKDKPCEAVIGEGRVWTGTTDAKGMVKFDPDDPLPTQLGSVIFRVWLDAGKKTSPVEWRLALGELEPPATTKGVQSRLNNLGCDAGPVDGVAGPRTRRATRRFQAANKLVVDGDAGWNSVDLETQTKQKLREVHGC